MLFLRKHGLAFLGISFVILIVLHYTFPEGIWTINDYQFNMSGDGLKNYYTFAYAVKYNCSFWFDGYLFPYGDMALYTDNQPIINWISARLYDVGLLSETHLLGWIHSLCIIGYILGGWLIYLIARELALPGWYAVIVSLFTILLSPQMFKIAGHYGLSYAFFIPLFWWIVIQIEQKKEGYYYGLLAIVTLISGFVHPYLMLSMILFGLAFILSKAIFSKTIDGRLFLWTMVPLAIFMIIGVAFDPIVDRPDNPAGVWAFKTEIRDLFPVQGWFNNSFGTALGLLDRHTESYSYAGISFLIFLFGIPIFLVARLRRYQWVNQLFRMSIEHRQYLCTGFFVLAFAMGIHILVTGGLILEWLPQLNQFRALGRFSWGYFYVFSVISSVWIYNAYRYIRSSLIAVLFLACIAGLNILDVYAIHQMTHHNIANYGSENLLLENTTLRDAIVESEYQIEDFQAAITLPISTEGVEKISFADDFFVKINALPFSFQTGMPLTSCIQSRASISQVMKILQLANSPYGDHSIREDISSDKDFLIIVPTRLKDLYNDLLARAIWIAQIPEVDIYKISKDQLFATRDWSEAADSSYVDMSKPLQELYLSEFEGENDFGLRSTGSFYSMSKDTAVMHWPIEVDRSIMFELSFWQYIEPSKSTIPSYHLETYHSDHTQRYRSPEFRDWDLDRVEVHGHWLRFKQNILLGPEDKYLSLIVSAPYMRIDWVMMKPENLNVYKETDSPDWVYSNHYFMSLSEN